MIMTMKKKERIAKTTQETLPVVTVRCNLLHPFS